MLRWQSLNYVNVSNQHMYTLNFHNVICQSYLKKGWECMERERERRKLSDSMNPLPYSGLVAGLASPRPRQSPASCSSISVPSGLLLASLSGPGCPCRTEDTLQKGTWELGGTRAPSVGGAQSPGGLGKKVGAWDTSEGPRGLPCILYSGSH